MTDKALLTISLVLLTGALAAQNSLGLKEAKARAVDNQIEIKNLDLELEAAEIQKRKAKSFVYPQVRFDGFLMHAIDPLLEMNNPGGNLPVYDGNPATLPTATSFAFLPSGNIGLLQKAGLANLSATQPIYTGGKIKISNELAALGVNIRKEQKNKATYDVLLKTEEQYWQIVALQEKQQTIDEYRKLLDRLYKQVNDAYAAGLIIRNDVYKVELEQSQLDLNESQLQNGKSLALRQFCNTIGVPYQPDLLLQDTIGNYQAPAHYLTPDNSYLGQLSEVKLLEGSVKANELQIGLKAAEYKPTVGVGANAFYLTQLEENTSGANVLGFVSVGVPLTHLWTEKFDLEEQRVRKEIAQNTLTDTEELLVLRKEKSWTDLRETYQRIQIMEERIEQANENLRVNQASYDSGVVTLSDLLEAKALQVEARNELVDAKSKYKTAIAAYLHSTGDYERLRH